MRLAVSTVEPILTLTAPGVSPPDLELPSTPIRVEVPK